MSNEIMFAWTVTRKMYGLRLGRGMSCNIKLAILKVGFNGGRFRGVYEYRVA